MNSPAWLGDDLIFLIGLPRSGSTLLQRILSGHAAIHSVAEPWLMLHPVYATRASGFDAEYDATLARQGLEDFLGGLDNGADRHDDAVRAYAHTLYAAARAGRGRPLFLDKTPRYWYILPDLKRLFPRARFIYLLRNPLAIAASVLRTWFDGDMAALAASTHARDLDDGPRAIADAIGRLDAHDHVLRYEDLVADPERTLRAVCGFLNIDFDAGMLDYGRRPRLAGRHGDAVSIERHARAVTDYRDTWESYLADRDRQAFARDYLVRLGAPTLDAWGYPADALLTRIAAQDTPAAADDAEADRLNADGQRRFAEGRHREARDLFQTVTARYPAFVMAYNNLAVANWQLGDPAGAVDALTRGLERAPLDRDLILNAAEILPALGHAQDACLLCDRYLEQAPGDTAVAATRKRLAAGQGEAPVVQCATEPAACTPVAGPAVDAEVLIGTSIAPFGIAKQQRAVQSWLDLGFRVLSLNVQHEIDELAPLFPGVRFVRADRDGRRAAGKPYVYLDDLLATLAREAQGVAGIVNSDIVLRAGQGLREFLAAQAADALVYGSRIDVDGLDDETGNRYHRGYDFFFFGRHLIAKIPSAEFMLGVPWWDYWLPAAFIMQRLPALRLDTPLAYHKRHGANYSGELLQSYGDAFVARCTGQPFVRLFEQCIELKVGDARYGVLADAALDHLSRHSGRVTLPRPVAQAATAVPATSARPRISAIVSTYNSEAFIADCLDDLARQTVADDIEIIVIDAASPQNERAVVERFQADHPECRVHYRRTERRIGVYAAWNLAARMAQGEYLITCSTNDRLRLDACEILARTLDENPEVALVYGNSFLSNRPHEAFHAPTLTSLYVWPAYSYRLLTEMCMVGPHPMWRRSVHDDVGFFDEDLVALGDQAFWLRLGETHRLMNLPDFTGLYYVSESSITGDLDRVQAETDRVQARHRAKCRFREWSQRRRRQVLLSERGAGIGLGLFVHCRAAEMAALAETLDALAALPDPGWTLTVLSPEACPDPAFVQEAQLDWVTYEAAADFVAARDQAVSESGADWIALVEPGDRPAPSLLHDLVAYLRNHPDCRVVYTDEDAAGESDKALTLKLKPDWNADLQRSAFYVGKLCLFQNAALREVGGVGDFVHVCNEDILWRIWSRFGDHAVGHIGEVLVTYDAAAGPPAPDVLRERRAVLEAHLARTRSGATLEAGMLPGTFEVRYPLLDTPSVSVLILAETDGANLARCIASVVDNTEYPGLEIVVGAPLRLAEQTAAFVAGRFGDRSGLRVVAVPEQGGTGLQLNSLAEQAGGEVLVFLRDQVVALQPTWLVHMLAHCLRADVGLVGARIVNQRRALVHAGIALGLGGSGVGLRVNEGMHLSTPGYLNFNQVVREVGAVSSLCMMIGTGDFVRSGGFAQTLGVTLFRDLDFSQRIRAEGRKVIWTPHATLMYSGEQAQVDGFAKSREHLREEAGYLHTHWLKVLARDPAWHPQLATMSRNFDLEIDFPCGWNPDLDTGPKVLAAGTGSLGSWYYRGQQPVERLTREGLVRSTFVRFPRGDAPLTFPGPVDIERMRPDTLLLHNAVHDMHIEALLAFRKHNDLFVVFGQDDLMFELPKSNPFAKTVYKDMKKRLRRCLDLSDRLVVTTEPLAQALRGWIDDVRVVPNYLDASVWSGLASRRGVGTRPRVGWAGATQHGGDLRLLEEVVRETAKDVDWVFLGMCPPALRPYIAEFHAGVPLAEYPAKLASLDLDLAVAPLEYNRFNEAKSNLRLLEYGALNWPVIASDIEPYRGAPVCLVGNQPRAWINAIREHLADRPALHAAGDRLGRWVQDHWLLQSHLDDWLDVLSPCRRSAASRSETS